MVIKNMSHYGIEMTEITSNKLIRLSKSCIGESEKAAVMEVLDSEFLGMGTRVHSFETKLTDFFNRPVACVSTGTSALQLALQACGIGSGDEVLVQSLTYVASFQAIRATGATPIACDVLPNSLTIDVNDAQRKMTDKTRAIMPVHYSGAVGNLNEIYEFAKKNNLRVIEDAAHAFGTVYENKVVGGFGDIACFSFDGIKNITSGEGGCVVTSDLAVLAKVKDARLLGVQNDSEKRYSGTRSWEFDVSDQGWRYHMSDIMAAIGIEQLSRLSVFSSKRRKLAKRYVENLKHEVKIGLFQYDYETVTPHIFPIRVESDKREKLRALLLENNIQTGIHYFPNHQLSLFAGSTNAKSLPVTTEIFPELMTLPLHPDLTFDEIDFISNRLIALIDAEDSKLSVQTQI